MWTGGYIICILFLTDDVNSDSRNVSINMYSVSIVLLFWNMLFDTVQKSAIKLHDITNELTQLESIFILFSINHFYFLSL